MSIFVYAFAKLWTASKTLGKFICRISKNILHLCQIYFFFLNERLTLWVVFPYQLSDEFSPLSAVCVLFGFLLYPRLVKPNLNCWAYLWHKYPLVRVLHVYPSTPEGLTLCVEDTVRLRLAGSLRHRHVCGIAQAEIRCEVGSGREWMCSGPGIAPLWALDIYIWLKVTACFITGRLTNFSLLHI